MARARALKKAKQKSFTSPRWWRKLREGENLPAVLGTRALVASSSWSPRRILLRGMRIAADMFYSAALLRHKLGDPHPPRVFVPEIVQPQAEPLYLELRWEDAFTPEAHQLRLSAGFVDAPFRGEVRTLEDPWDAPGRSNYLCLYDGGSLVGQLRLTRVGSAESSPVTCWTWRRMEPWTDGDLAYDITRTALAPTVRGRGLYGYLVYLASAAARNAQAREVQLIARPTITSAMRLIHHGFIPRGETEASKDIPGVLRHTVEVAAFRRDLRQTGEWEDALFARLLRRLAASSVTLRWKP